MKKLPRKILKTALVFCLLIVATACGPSSEPDHVFTPILPQASEMGRSTAIYLRDLNHNGRMETVSITAQNPLGQPWELYAEPPYGLQVEQDGHPLGISSITFADAWSEDGQELIISITLDENNPHLEISTDGVESAIIEVTYSGSHFGKIRSGNYELNQIVAGDRDAGDTEIDLAAPAPLVGRYRDVNRDGTVDRVEIDFSPDTALIGRLTGWTISNPGGVGLGHLSLLSRKGGQFRFSIEGKKGITGSEVEPILSFEAGSGMIADGSGNTAVSFSIPLQDAAAPAILSAHYRNRTGSKFRLTFDPQARMLYGMAYPLTYEFSVPAGSGPVSAWRRDSSTDPWIPVPEKTPADFFNGAEAYRYDAAAGKIYVSVAPTAGQDELDLFLSSPETDELAATFVGISRYYDNRRAAVVASADDWTGQANSSFIAACELFRSKQVWLTVGIVADFNWLGQPPNWEKVQEQVDWGYVEPAAHGMSHINWFELSDFDLEIGGSKKAILENIVMPANFRVGERQYLYAWLEPFGYSDDLTRYLLGAHGYLADRAYTNDDDRLAAWDSENGLFDRSYFTLELGRENAYELYRAFTDRVFAAGDVLHFAFHPWEEKVDLNPGGRVSQVLDYIKERNDIWYVGFGQLYLYRFTAERGVVVEALDQKADLVELKLSAEALERLSLVYRAEDWTFLAGGSVGFKTLSGGWIDGNSILLTATGASPGVTDGRRPVLDYSGTNSIGDQAGNVTAPFKIELSCGILY